MYYVTCLFSSLHLSIVLRGEDERSSQFEGNVAHFTLLAEKLGAELNYPALSCLMWNSHFPAQHQHNNAERADICRGGGMQMLLRAPRLLLLFFRQPFKISPSQGNQYCVPSGSPWPALSPTAVKALLPRFTSRWVRAWCVRKCSHSPAYRSYGAHYGSKLVGD